MTERRRNPRRLSFTLDLIHLIVGVVVIILSITAFLNPEDHLAFFPLIFFLAAFLTALNGAVRFRTAGRSRQKKVTGLLGILIGVILAVIGIASAIILL